jgi:hypothetical protein
MRSGWVLTFWRFKGPRAGLEIKETDSKLALGSPGGPLYEARLSLSARATTA